MHDTFCLAQTHLTWCSMVVFELGSMPAFRRCRRRRVQLHPFRRDLTLDGYPIHGNGPKLGGGEGTAIMWFLACSKSESKIQLGSVCNISMQSLPGLDSIYIYICIRTCVYHYLS